MWWTEGSSNRLPVLFSMVLLFPNVVCGPSLRWTCEIYPKIWMYTPSEKTISTGTISLHLKSVRFWLFFPTVHTQTTAVAVVTTRVNGTVTVSSSHSQSLHWEGTSERFQLSSISSVADSCWHSLCPSARHFVSWAVIGSDALTFSLSVHWAGKSPDLRPLLLSSQRNCLVFLASEGDCWLFFCCVSFFDNYVEQKWRKSKHSTQQWHSCKKHINNSPFIVVPVGFSHDLQICGHIAFELSDYMVLNLYSVVASTGHTLILGFYLKWFPLLIRIPFILRKLLLLIWS